MTHTTTNLTPDFYIDERGNWLISTFKIWKADEEGCLISKFFEEEAKKPSHLRSNVCMISCRCSKCNPCTM